MISKLFSHADLILLPILLSLVIGFLMLHSIAPQVFPQYYIYIALSVVFFIIFLRTDFDLLIAFSPVLYIGSIFLLVLPIILGQVTRGTIRWIPIGSFNLQPAEIVRPFLILFFANYFTSRSLNHSRIVMSLFLMALPLILIFLQPSLGVTVLTLAGFVGVILTLSIPLKYYVRAFLSAGFLMPFSWLFLANYQKQRVLSLLSPNSDPTGRGYNSIQSVIAVGSGMIHGRGLGNGVQTQLSFLPEKHTDFMFAAISEELGFVGSTLIVLMMGAILFSLTKLYESAPTQIKKAYISGVFATLFLQIFVHIGMNMGMLPITGIPLPLVSYGGSSLLSTGIMLGIALQAGMFSGKIQSI